MPGSAYHGNGAGWAISVAWIDSRPVRRQPDPLDENAGPLHFRGAGDLSGGLRRLHLHRRTDSFVHAAARGPNAGAADGGGRLISALTPRLPSAAQFSLFFSVLHKTAKL